MEGKNSFVLYADMIHVVEKLTDEQAGKLMKHLLRYVNDLNPKLQDTLLDLVFEPLKQNLKRDLNKWKQTKSTRSENGKLGGIKSGESRRKKQIKANEASASKSKQTKQSQANEAVNVNVSVTVNVTVKEQIEKYIKEHPGKYTEQMYADFTRYWGEPFQNGKFKGKERWQGQDTWELGGRLATWFKRSNNYSSSQNSVPQKPIKVLLSRDEK